ncbi:AIR synthase related protein [Micromonospora sp. WMMD1082]|uniref:thiamine-phosphate kinase n=1 Tax=Micromonospora sp. WMMD1082 TaxID=3016104 RepID=UPI002417FB76|nr:AIR synthase related protein [Micromonospora sp. WMMD1082]MDG4792958.1 AIR synthase related protein [Micromonospora sp. WMMD1082]
MTSTAWNRLSLNAAEGSLITAIRECMVRSPRQLNNAFEADAELLDLGAAGLLAMTIDTLNNGAELATVTTPYAKGWLTTTVSVSDLAAVAADPVAVLVSCSLRRDKWTLDDAREFGRGASDAAERYGCHIVGGDTNWADEESFTSCALGTVPRGSVLSRVGARPGDALYVTGPIGAGNAVGFRALALGGTGEGEPWLPEARVAAGDPLRRYARACIDTSDGLLSAAVSLAELNGLGTEVVLRDEVYAPIVSAIADSAQLPRWCSAAAEWGEFELLYAVDPADAEQCAQALSERGLHPTHVGQLVAGPELLLFDESGERRELRNLLLRMRALDPAGSLLADLRALLAGGT